MKLEALCKVLNVSPNYVLYHWKYFVEVQAKRGIYVTRIGRGKDKEYGLRFSCMPNFCFNEEEFFEGKIY